MSDEHLKDPKDYSFEKGYMSIHELLAANGVNQRALREQFDRQEAIDNQETEDDIQADILSQKVRTRVAKERLINDLKGSLGTDIKRDPSGVRIIKKPWYVRLANFFKKIFTKF